MSTDESPEPEVSDKVVTDEDRDAAYQEGYDAASDSKQWIKLCLSVLTAEIDLADFDPMSLDAVREMRTEAARFVSRTLRRDLEASHLDE